MKLAGYDIKDGDDPRQIIVFRREHIEESGKKDIRFLVWDKENPKFGISDASFSQRAGVPIRDKKPIIQKFLKNIIEKGEAKTCYHYIGATEEAPGGYLTETIPPICEIKRYDSHTISEIKRIKDFIDAL
jgi:hypothetical protein